jgi:hypothetical protein
VSAALNPVQVCPNCGRHIAPPPRAACPFCRRPLTPAEAPGADHTLQPAGDGRPGERRDDSGFVAGLVETTRQVISAPTAFFTAMPTRDGLGAPLLYGVVVGSLAFVLMIGVALALVGLIELVAPRPGAGPAGATSLGELLLSFLFWLVATPVGVVIILFTEAGLTHLLLMMLRAAREPFEATFRVSCYARAVTLVLAVPVVGWVAGPVWLVVVRVLGLVASQHCSGGRAAAAVLIPPLVCCCVQGLLYVAVFGLAALAVLTAAASG